MRASFLTTGLAVLLASVPALLAQQESDQLYFVGFEAPRGSISVAGQDEIQVVLRWDTLEGELPADLEEFELRRDGVPIGVLPASGTMTAAEIDSLYAGAHNERRRLEAIRWLSEETPEEPITAAELSDALLERVLANPARSLLASRVDLNVALARFRAFLDADAPPGVHEYELVGRFAGGGQRRLGRLELEVDGVADPLPSGRDLEQVTLARCDAPEAMKAHGTVALNWDHPGEGIIDRYAWSLRIAGYDLYRSRGSEPILGPVSLRALAASRRHDPHGRVVLPRLEKVNDQPIMVSGSAAREALYEGFNPAFAQFFETLDELAAVGLRPGDRRTYFLVARDLSGNWGRTTRVRVTVPDAEAPPAPWSVRAFSDGIGARVALTWPRIEARSYHRQYPLGRRYCNLETARFDERLEFVTAGEQCDGETRSGVDLAVADYLVYRFADGGRALRFVDSDGDGFFDGDERQAPSDPGTACDPAQPDPESSPLTNNLVATVTPESALTRRGGQAVLEFSDPLPAALPGQVFWYRVAARDAAGNVGPLSQPVRGFVPDRALPDRGDLQAELDFGRRVCRYRARLTERPNDGETFAVDTSTADAARRVRARCAAGPGELTRPARLLPVALRDDGARTARLPAPECTPLVSPVGGCGAVPAAVDYLGRRGELLATAVYPEGFGGCPAVASQLEEVEGSCEIERIEPGEVVPEEEGPVIDPSGLGLCVTVWRDRGESTVRHASWCPGDPPLLVDFPDTGSDPICLAISSRNDNAQNSVRWHLPCFRRPGTPSPPSPIGIEFQPGSGSATLRFGHAERPAQGAVVAWQRKGDPASRQLRYVPRPVGVAAGEPISLEIDIGPEPAGAAWHEEWCLSGFSVGGALAGDPGTGWSDWSVEACDDRRPPGAPAPQFLPWPPVPVPATGEPLEAAYAPFDEMGVVLLSPPLGAHVADDPDACLPFPGACDLINGPPCFPEPGVAPAVVTSGCSFCSLVPAAMTVTPRFVVYRQSRADEEAAASDFHQVTPLLETPWCFADQDASPAASTLDEPWVTIAEVLTPHPWSGLRILYTDRFPFRGGGELRYQFVFFDGRGEIAGQRLSNWVAVP